MVTQDPAALKPGDYLEPGTYRVTDDARANGAHSMWAGDTFTLTQKAQVNSDLEVYPASAGASSLQLLTSFYVKVSDLTPALADCPMPADDEPDEGEPARLPHSLYWTDAHGALRSVDDFDDEPESYELTLLRAALHWHAETLP